MNTYFFADDQGNGFSVPENTVIGKGPKTLRQLLNEALSSSTGESSVYIVNGTAYFIRKNGENLYQCTNDGCKFRRTISRIDVNPLTTSLLSRFTQNKGSDSSLQFFKTIKIDDGGVTGTEQVFTIRIDQHYKLTIDLSINQRRAFLARGQAGVEVDVGFGDPRSVSIDDFVKSNALSPHPPTLEEMRQINADIERFIEKHKITFGPDGFSTDGRIDPILKANLEKKQKPEGGNRVKTRRRRSKRRSLRRKKSRRR